LLDKFTEKAIKAVINSQEEARRLSHSQIGTQHLLLGLVQEGTGIPVRVLRAVGVTIEELREKVAESKSLTKNTGILNEVIFSNQAIQALKDASEQAKNLGYVYVGSEHLFISLLSNENFAAVKVLKDLEVDVDRIIETVTRITVKRSLNRAHPEIQQSKKLTEISKAIQSKIFELPFSLESESTSEIINLAKQEMKAFNNDTIGTEHLLLAITKSQNNNLKSLLEENNINYNQLLEYLSYHQDRSPEYLDVNFQLTPVAFKVLEKAHEIATTLGYGSVKPEHIMLGMLKEDKGLVKAIFENKSINTQQLYQRIIEPIEKQRPPTLSIIKLAQEEARMLDYNVVGTEHILLGLLSVGIGIASNVLQNLGITLQDARHEVKKVVGYGSYDSNVEMTFTPRAKKLLELAWEEAKRKDYTRIESEHLLIAITKLKDSMAMNILTGLGVDSIEITQGIMTSLDSKSIDVNQ
jgi:ATP-dependent Clp protease ATP-binding subunit ClpA